MNSLTSQKRLMGPMCPIGPMSPMIPIAIERLGDPESIPAILPGITLSPIRNNVYENADGKRSVRESLQGSGIDESGIPLWGPGYLCLRACSFPFVPLFSFPEPAGVSRLRLVPVT